jgi:hydrogenase maturation protease
MRTLVLGLGNTLLRDDGVAIRVVRALKEYLSTSSDIEVAESSLSGLALIDTVIGYDKVIILDAIPVEGENVGELREISSNELEEVPLAVSPHFTGIPSLVKVGKKLGYHVPSEIKVFGITVKDPFSFGEELTPEVAAAIPQIVKQVLELLKT